MSLSSTPSHENASIVMNEPSSSDEQIVFGSPCSTTPGDDRTAITTTLSEDIANQLCEEVEDALTVGVSCLPGMIDKPETLVEKLMMPYKTNIDVLELYCQRNIFSLDMYKKSRRQQIVQAYVTTNGNSTTSKDDTMKESKADTNHDDEVIVDSSSLDPSSSLLLPSSKDQVPTDEQLDALKGKVAQLRLRLAKLHQQKEVLTCQVQEWKVADEMSRSTTTAVLPSTSTSTDSDDDDLDHNGEESKTTNNLYESVSAAMIGNELLAQVHQQSVELMEQLKHKHKKNKRHAMDADDDDDNHDDNEDNARKKSKKPETTATTLEERFEQDRQVIPATANQHEEFQHLRQKLGGGNENDTATDGGASSSSS